MAPTTRPNILFFFPDQHRHDWLSGETDGVRTPNLAALAERGARFTRAVCPSPLCAPSRACLATGVEYDRCLAPDNSVDLPLDAPTFYRMLRDRAGYHVAGCGKFDLAKALHDWDVAGTRRLAEWGFSAGVDSEGKWDGVNSGRVEPRGPFLAYLESRGLRHAYLEDMDRRRGERTASFACPLDDEAYGDNWVARNGLALLDAAPADRPWFLQINFPGPHDPWDVTESMAESVRGRDVPPASGNDRDDAEAVLGARRNYTAMVENIDRWVGRYVDWLRERGQLDRTLIVYSSDHGEMLGDRGMWGKSQPFRASIGVPMLLAGPGVARGVVCDSPATNLDLTATFLEAAELDVPFGMDSQSLWPVLTGRVSFARTVVRSGLHSWRVLCGRQWKYVHGGSGQPEMLFDLAQDPDERENLAGRQDADVQAALAQCRAKVEENRTSAP